jgi:hypothetical protein
MYAKRATDRLLYAMQNENAPGSFANQAKALEQVPSGLDEAQLLNLLKRFLCVSEARVVLVNLFDARFAQTNSFDGKVWKLVAWVQQNRPGLDLKSPPQR